MNKSIIIILIISCFIITAQSAYASQTCGATQTNCTSCEQDGNNTATLRCTACAAGYYVDKSTILYACTACGTGASGCTQLSSGRLQYTGCSTAGYISPPVSCGLNNTADSGCVACSTYDANAATCAYNAILTCNAGYQLSVDNWHCVTCDATKGTCTGALTCLDGYYRVKGDLTMGTEDQCVACPLTNSTCTANAITVADTKFCQYNTSTSTITCGDCPGNATCSDSSNRGVFYKDDKLITTNGQDIVCNDGFYRVIHPGSNHVMCLVCPTNTYCSSSGARCMPGFYPQMNPEDHSLSCQTCPKPLRAGTDFCSEVTGLSCCKGYFLSIKKDECIQCPVLDPVTKRPPEGVKFCDPTNGFVCQPGYYNIDNECILPQNAKASSQLLGASLIFILGALSLLF